MVPDKSLEFVFTETVPETRGTGTFTAVKRDLDVTTYHPVCDNAGGIHRFPLASQVCADGAYDNLNQLLIANP